MRSADKLKDAYKENQKKSILGLQNYVNKGGGKVKETVYL